MLSFAPDALDIAPEKLQAISGVPTSRGYRNPPAGVSIDADTFPAAPQGSAQLTDLVGDKHTYVATATKIYKLNGSSWDDVSRVGDYTSGTARTAFVAYGNTKLAINKETQLQAATSGDFADVANAPMASTMEAVHGFVIVGDTDDTGTGLTTAYGDQPHRIWWSQIASAGGPTASWEPDVSKQCGSELLVQTHGGIVCLKRLNDFCIVYKGDSLYIGSYVDVPNVWKFDCYSTNVGCPARDGVVSVGNVHYFVAKNDFYAFDGASLRSIGILVKDTFFGRLNRAQMSKIQALLDEAAKLIYWFYPTTSEVLDACIVYHYDTERWGHFSLTVKEVFPTQTGSVTYASMGTRFGNYDDAELGALSYGDPYFRASTPILAYIGSDLIVRDLSGSGSALTFTTGWFGNEDVVSLCNRVKPRFRIAPSSGSLDGRTCMNLGETPSLVSLASTLFSGRHDVLQAGRYHQFDASYTGACEIEAVVAKLQPESDE